MHGLNDAHKEYNGHSENMCMFHVCVSLRAFNQLKLNPTTLNSYSIA